MAEAPMNRRQFVAACAGLSAAALPFSVKAGNQGRRMSVDEDDPGYAEWMRWRPLGVLLDGSELKDCVTADEICGMAIVYRRGTDGKLVLNYERDAVERDIRYGVVKIVGRDG